MRLELTETMWLDRRCELSLAELAELSGLSENDLQQLIDYDALAPTHAGSGVTTFSADCLVTARIARRLRNDFELDTPGLALVLTLVERIRDLESSLRGARAGSPHVRREP